MSSTNPKDHQFGSWINANVISRSQNTRVSHKLYNVSLAKHAIPCKSDCITLIATSGKFKVIN
uniref:Uncharacterized protein n=1 Tax=Arundo donax TaxID=35708 RepID=A0A0A9ECJ6_ARUDO